MLCKYKNLFGEPNKGFHSVRLFNIAILDLGGTIFIAFLLSKIMKISFISLLIILLLLGIIMHRLFCVRTTIDKILFKK